MEREFLAADVEGIEGVGAVGAVFEQEFLGLGEFFAGLVLAEAVASPVDSWRRDGKDEVEIVRAVEEGHEPYIRPIGLVSGYIYPT